MFSLIVLISAAAAVAPTETAPTNTALSNGTLPVGPPAPHLARDPATQWQLSRGSAWRDFRDRWGGSMRWDQRDGSPRFWYGSGPSVVQSDHLVEELAALAGVPLEELRLTLDRVHDGQQPQGHQPQRQLLRWDRTWKGAPVVGDQILLVVVDGRIAGAWIQLTPIHLTVDPQPGQVVLPLPDGTDRRTRPALVTPTLEADQQVFRDAGGRVLYRYDTRRHGTAQVRYLQRTVGDSMLDAPLRQVDLTDVDGTAIRTDDDGVHSGVAPLQLVLDGPVLGVTVTGEAVTLSGLDADFTVVGGDDVAQSAATVQHHFHVVRDWLADLWPDHAWLPERVPADVEIDGRCNAYYTGGTINFYRATPGVCVALGEIADVVYHEVGHGIHDYGLAGGTFAGDISEGSSDYVSATILDDPVLAPGAWGDGTWIREIETDRRYPDDVSGEVHNDGLIWASLLWNLRQSWSDADGDAGVQATDALFLATLEQGPTLTDVAEALLLADDDDGDLTNGTPHACELLDLLNHHGLGPGPIGIVSLDHKPLEAQASATDGYGVVVDIFDLTVDCSGLDHDSITLWYTIDPDLPAPTLLPGGGGSSSSDTGSSDTGSSDTGSSDTGLPDLDEGYEGFAGWTAISLSNDGASWTGQIPRQPANAQVRYVVSLASSDGSQILTTHGGDPDAVYDFWVGDRAASWCEDFEDGAEDWQHGVGLSPDDPGPADAIDEWAFGSPSGEGSWDPPSAWDGTSVAGIDLAGDYDPNTRLHLQAPWVTVDTDGLMPLLTYRRWLTVEDGFYDQAQLWLGSQLAWSNGVTDGGGVHHLDQTWTQHDLDLTDRLDEDLGITPRWTLQTDGGLEYGGWHLDDVCVVQLDDVPGHYRAADLSASDDLDDQVTVTWTSPWIQPLSALVLVAQLDDWPADPDDGRIVHVDFSPQWGESVTVADPWVAPGETWHYALFAASRDSEDWMLSVVEGENADIGGIPADAPEPDDDTGLAGDSGAAPEAADGGQAHADATGKDAGCGCASRPGAVPGLAAVWLAAVWLGGLLLVGLRRRT